MNDVTAGMLIPPYVATLPLFDIPAARYPARYAGCSLENVSARTLGRLTSSLKSFGVPLSSLASESTIANWMVGLAFAAPAVAEASRNPADTISVHFLARNASMFGL